MSSPNRAERRRQERAAAKARALYHGTAGVLADEIARDGLRVGQEGRVFLTDSRAIARSYAIWEAARQAQRGHPGRPHIGAIITVSVPMALTVEQNSYPPALPWQTRMLDGVSYFTTQPIGPDLIGPIELWEIEELLDGDTLDTVIADLMRVCRAVPRAGAIGDAAPMIARSALHNAVPDHWGLLDAIREASPNARSRWHGEKHWLGVLAAAVRILERGCRADPAVLLAFCLLHDAQRIGEGHDPRHGERAAKLADRLDGDLLHLDAGQRDRLRRALIDHDRGKTSTDETIGACWDADRLTLPRVGIAVDAALLSTVEARALLAAGGRVPDPADCDWDWALSRMYLLAASGAVTRIRYPRGDLLTTTALTAAGLG